MPAGFQDAEETRCACNVRLSTRRKRKTGPMHPLAVYHCRAHGIYFTVYPPGFGRYDRVRMLPQEPEGWEDPGSSMIAGAVALTRGWLIPNELIEDERGPVRRTVIRRATKVAEVLGLDGPEVASEVMSALDLPGLALRHEGSRPQRILHRVSQLKQMPAGPDRWSRMLEAMSVTGRLDGVLLIDSLRVGKLIDASSLAARALRGPPPAPRGVDDFVLEASRPAP